MKAARFESLQSLPAHVGQEVAVSDWLLIEQARVNVFAEVTEDLQWIHIDEERARRESPYGGTIAHGYLTLSLVPRLANSCIGFGGVSMAVNYGLNKVRFMAPVRVGSRIRGRFMLLSCEPLPGGLDVGAQLVLQATIDIEGADKPACVAEVVSRRYA